MSSDNPILVVEDNQVDVISLRRAFRKLNIVNPLQVALDGVDALTTLRTSLEPPPKIIFLDLNMPRMGGIEFLLELRSEVRFDDVEVIILTTSNWYNDKIKAFDLGIAGYLVKPINQENLQTLTVTVKPDYWHFKE